MLPGTNASIVVLALLLGITEDRRTRHRRFHATVARGRVVLRRVRRHVEGVQGAEADRFERIEVRMEAMQHQMRGMS